MKLSTYISVIFASVFLFLTPLLAQEASSPPEDNANYSQEQNSQFKQGRTVVLANETIWAPYYGKELENGGYTTEIIRQALKKVGYELKIAWLPWARALYSAKHGKYNGLGTCYFNDERAENFAFTDPIGNTEIAFFILKGRNIKYSAMEDLKPYIIGTTRGYAYPEVFTSATYLQTENASNLVLNIRKLLNGRVDLIIASKKVVRYLLQTKFPKEINSLEAVSPPLKTVPLHVAFSKARKDHKRKVKAFNRGLKAIKDDGTFEAILSHYRFYGNNYTLAFNFVTQDFPPFSYNIGSVVSGPVMEVVQAVCNDMKVKCQVKLLPWNIAQTRVNSGEANALFAVGWNKDREKQLYFSSPVLESEYGFFVLNDNPMKFKSISDIKGYKVGVYGHSNTSHSLYEIQQKGADIEIHMAHDNELSFKMLSTRQIHAVYSNRDVGHAILSKLYLKNIKYAGTHKKLKYYIGFSKEFADEKAVESFNSTFRKLHKSGKVKSILGQYFMEPVSIEDVVK